MVDKSLVKNRIRSIRQLPIGELTAADMNAFGGIGFIRYFRSAGYNLLMNSSIVVRLQVLLRLRKDIANSNWAYIAYGKRSRYRCRYFNSTNRFLYKIQYRNLHKEGDNPEQERVSKIFEP